MGHDITLSLNYQNLGHLLAQLRDAPLVQAAPDLAEKVRNAISFHQQLASEYAQLLQEHQALKQELSRLTREPDEIVSGAARPALFSKYERLREAGMEANAVYWAARQDGLDNIELLKMLRQVFQFSLSEAQNTIAEAEQLELQAA